MGLIDSEEFEQIAIEWARRTAVEQGFPAMIADEEVLETIATLLCEGRIRPGAGQTRHAGRTRSGSKRLRPGTAGPTSA